MNSSILYGHDPHPNIVSVQQIHDNRMRIYIRKNKIVNSQDYDFFPFFLLSEKHYLEGYERKHWIKHLDGSNYFCYLVAFTQWFDMFACIRHIIARYNQETENHIISFTDLPIIHLNLDPVSQFLIQTGKTLFKEMEFEDLYRLQLYIETHKKPGYRFSNPARKEDRITLIVISDSKGQEFIIGKKEKSEIEVLEKFVTYIQELDPDVIEGHHLQDFIIPYILKRCEINDYEFCIGRDKSQPKIIEPNYLEIYNPIDTPSYTVAGRQLIDTHLLLQSYDSTNRISISHNLVAASEQLGYEPNKTKPEHLETENETEILINKCREYINRIKFISDSILPAYFEQAKIFPFNLDTIIKTGPASKIESILKREYVRQKHSIPKPQLQISKTGSHTGLFLRGVIGPVLFVEIDSVFATIVVNEGFRPSMDRLNIFNKMLNELIELSELKNNLHSTIKFLLYSSFGYLTYHRGLFNDYNLALKITEIVNSLISRLIESIQLRGGIVIEADIDGIYFVPPQHVKDVEGEEKFIKRINEDIPPNYKLLIAGRYKKILSYKKKNYATIDYDNRIQIKGSALIAKNLKRFGKNYIQQCIECLLNENFKALHNLYVSIYRDILNHSWQIHDFMKTETLKESIEVYKTDVANNKRNRSAAYELAIRTNKNWKPGDKISYYITGTDANIKTYENCKLAEDWNPLFPDENTSYYIKNLEEFSLRFEDFFNKEDYKTIFSTEEVLDFAFDNIKIINTPLPQEQPIADEHLKQTSMEEPSIWLDED